MKIHEVIRLRNVYGGETTLNDLVNLIQGNKIYRCPKCGHEWEDTWDSQCDDDCPECENRHISPYESEEADA